MIEPPAQFGIVVCCYSDEVGRRGRANVLGLRHARGDRASASTALDGIRRRIVILVRNRRLQSLSARPAETIGGDQDIVDCTILSARMAGQRWSKCRIAGRTLRLVS